MKILVTGKGGREHALITALSESPQKHELFAYPGSDAIAALATRVDVAWTAGIDHWMTQNGIDLCVAGEEAWLVKDRGLSNLCAEAGIPCWGPLKEIAQLEASKTFAKKFLQRHGIPTAGFHDLHERGGGQGGADGDAHRAEVRRTGRRQGRGGLHLERGGGAFVDDVMEKRCFGAGDLLVEKCLTGPEISVFASVCDESYQILMPARDYKRIRDNDQGPNTGGMGAVASLELAEPALMQRIEREIVQPTVQGILKDGLKYRGFLYFGLMLTPDGAAGHRVQLPFWRSRSRGRAADAAR
jgi:phosphoribosylamine--glycine ligase